MFLPLKDKNPTLHFPVVTVSLIIANIAVFLYEFSLGSDVNALIAAAAHEPRVPLYDDYVRSLGGDPQAALPGG